MDISNNAKISHLPAQSPYAHLKPIICLVVAPLATTSTFFMDVLLPALRQILEQNPYFWQVVSSNDKKYNDNPQHNITEWMELAEIYIIDISEQHPDTFIELGRICEYQKQKNTNAPIIVLESKTDVRRKMSQRDGVMQISYTTFSGKHAIDDLTDEIKKEIEGRRSIQKLNVTRQAHYLSPYVLIDTAKVREIDAPILAERYRTMEYFINVPPNHITRQIKDLKTTMAKLYQEEIRNLLNDIQS